MLRLEEEDLYAGIATSGSGGGGGGSSTKYGATISNFLGDVDSNGVLQEPTSEINLVFTGVKVIGNSVALNFPKMKTSRGQEAIQATPTVLSASFPDLEEVNEDGFYDAFQGTGIQSVSFPKLKYIRAKAGSSYNYYAFNQAFANGSYYWNGQYVGGLTSISFPELEEISGILYSFNGTFNNNRNLTTISFPKLKKVADCLYGCFNECPLTTVEFPLLEEADGFMWFSNLTTITSISLPKLKKLGTNGLGAYYNGAFEKTSVTSVTFPMLSDLTNAYYGFNNTFKNCASLTSLSFPALTSTSFGNIQSQFNNMLSGCTGVTVHFPSNLQSVIGSWSDVTAGFGGTNTTVLFDLPATE